MKYSYNEIYSELCNIIASSFFANSFLSITKKIPFLINVFKQGFGHLFDQFDCVNWFRHEVNRSLRNKISPRRIRVSRGCQGSSASPHGVVVVGFVSPLVICLQIPRCPLTLLFLDHSSPTVILFLQAMTPIKKETQNYLSIYRLCICSIKFQAVYFTAIM